MSKENALQNNLSAEWGLLQNQFDAYEKYSLIIKLVAIILFAVLLVGGLDSFYASALIATLWLQDAIWKTFQSRIETRILKLEKAIANNEDIKAFQFNSEYEASRPSTVGLIAEYLKQACRPTIAFPHVALALILAIVTFT